MGRTPVERFRGRIRKPRVSDAEHGRIEVTGERMGVVAASTAVAGRSSTGDTGRYRESRPLTPFWIRCLGPRRTAMSQRPPSGADIEYDSWAYAGPAVAGITEALAGINPRSKFYVDAAGNVQVVWLSANIQPFRADMIRADLSRDFSALHVINQVVATALDLDRTTTTRYTSSVAVDLDDDMDTVVFEGTLEGGADNTRWALNFRQPNGTYFPVPCRR